MSAEREWLPMERETAITDVRIPFWRIVWLLIVFSIAAIPATIVMTTLAAVVAWFLAAITVAMGVLA